MITHLDDALIAAMRAGAIDEVRAAVAAQPALCTAVDAGGMTLLHLAVATDQPALLADLLAHPAVDVEARQTSHGRTALHMAALKGRVALVQALLTAGANPLATDAAGLRALDHASTPACVAALREATLHPQQTVWQAMSVNATLRLQRLLAAVPDLGDSRDRFGRTLVHAAVSTGQQAMLDVLLAAGLSPDTHDTEGETPLHTAVRRADVGAVLALLAAGASPAARDGQGFTPLHMAAGHGDATHSLAPPPPDGLRVDGGTAAMPTQCAFDFGGPPTPPSELTPSRQTPRPTPGPAASAYLRIAEALLAHGAAADVQARGGTTPLHLAAHTNDQSLAALLLTQGAAPDVPLALWRATAAHIAACRVDTAMLDLLYRHGADRHARDAHGRTPTALLLASRDTADSAP